MGVTGLWSILDDLGEDQDVGDLSGKRIAIDLSGWIVQAMKTPGLNKRKKPHITLLFQRVHKLLQRGVHLIFVMDGKMPDSKEDEFMKRNQYGNIDRQKLHEYAQECCDLLRSLGVPCIKASGEGEAGCAFLYMNQIVDIVITEDGDSLLYGADIVCRGFVNYKHGKSENTKYKVYSLKSKKNKLKLDRYKLIVIALLLGCDYGRGVPGVGKETVLKFLDQNVDFLQRLKDWKEMSETQLFPDYDPMLKKQMHCKLCNHIGSPAKHEREGCDLCDSKTSCHPKSKIPCSCAWHKSDKMPLKAELKIYNAVKEIANFPDQEIINEYCDYKDEIPDPDTLKWKCPNKSDFLNIAYASNFKNPHSLFINMMTLWQLSKLSKDHLFDKTDFLYEPVSIVKQKTVNGEAKFVVKWKEKGEDLLAETTECVDTFEKSYPKIVEAYNKNKDASKRKKVSKPMKGSTEERNTKVIPLKSTPKLNLENVNQLDKESSYTSLSEYKPLNESFDFLELPLADRVKLLTNQPRNVQHKSPVLKSLMPENLYKATSFKYQQDNNVHDSNACCLSKGIISYLCNRETDFSELFDNASESVLLNSYSKQLNNSVNFLSSTSDKNKHLCLFSDSDDSFQNISCGKNEELCNLLSNCNMKYSLLSEDVCQTKVGTPYVLNSSNCKHKNNSLRVLQTESSFCESPNCHGSLKPVYSINRKMMDCDYTYSSFASSSLLYSTPKSKPDFLLRKSLQSKSSKPSNVFEKDNLVQIFPPVIFDSSSDSIV